MTVATATERTALVVAGMHRSGTSAMARVLGLCGGAMPDRLIGAASDNPLGFWEPRDMVSLNDEILRTVGSAWDDLFGFRADGLANAEAAQFLPRARSAVSLNYADTPLAVIKDPRVSLVTTLWRRALEAEGLSPAFVIMVRDPLEVARSIAARDNAPIQGSMLAWLSHMIAVERDTRDAPRVFVSYADLVEDWRPVLDRVRRELAMTLSISSEQEAEISAFLTPSARHHATPETAWIDRPDIWPGVADAWRWMKAAAQGTDNLPPFPETIVNDLADLEAQVGPVLKAQAARAEQREQELQAVIADRETTLLRLKAQAQEYKAVDAERAQALAEAKAEAARTLEDVRRLEDLEGRTSQALKQSDAALETARIRNESLAQDAAATAAIASEDARMAAQREQELHLTIGALTDRCETLDTRRAVAEAQTSSLEAERDALAIQHNDATARVEALTQRLDNILSSASWGVTRPIRVVGKRLRALTRDQ